jgi:hypothetical protein
VIEAALVLAAIAVPSAGVWAWLSVAPDVLLTGGFWLVAAGLGFGLPTGLVYHLELRRSLRALGALPRRWWLRPIALHPRLPAEDFSRVMRWCRLGALGCAVAFLGCAVFALGVFRIVFAR